MCKGKGEEKSRQERIKETMDLEHDSSLVSYKTGHSPSRLPKCFCSQFPFSSLVYVFLLGRVLSTLWVLNHRTREKFSHSLSTKKLQVIGAHTFLGSRVFKTCIITEVKALAIVPSFI